MKTIILCGGKGTRMREETEYRPKPLVEVGGRPILWHIMKIYAHYGFNEFVIALGYKGDMIKDYFLNYRTHEGDFTLHTKSNTIHLHNGAQDDFMITFVDTGSESETGERLKRLKPYISDEEFMLTYGDGVADIDIGKLVAFHRSQGTIGTITGAHPYSKYGFVNINTDRSLVTNFHEKPLMHDDYVNSGFMVFNRKVFDYVGDEMLEANTLPHLAKEGQLSLYPHKGFWKAMDTVKEAEELNKLWEKEKPWHVWQESK